MSVFAIDDGQTVEYTQYHAPGGSSVFNVEGHMGFCIEPGVTAPPSGTGVADRVSQQDRLAKTMYYISSNGFDQKLEEDDPSLNINWAAVSEAMVQYAYNGQSAADHWRDVYGWSEYRINRIISYVEAADSLTVPSNFRVFTVYAGDYQDFGVFYTEPVGKLKLKKVSSNTGITG